MQSNERLKVLEKIEKLTQDITISMNAIRQENEKQLDLLAEELCK